VASIGEDEGAWFCILELALAGREKNKLHLGGLLRLEERTEEGDEWRRQ
jgi:hypothetical protein